MNRIHAKLRVVSLLVLTSFCVPAPAQESDERKSKAGQEVAAANTLAVLWRAPGNIASRDLRYGPGGAARLPKGKLTFLEEDLDGVNPKFDVRDENGVRWRVKPGGEARAETAATRLLWAVGYFADEDYYLPEIRVEGMPKLQRGEEFVSKGGVLKGVRLERRPEGRKKVGVWNWSKNPFVGTRELNGLRVMMALMNNWDIKKENNAIYSEAGEHHYLVSDVGATFGRSGNTFHRDKDNLKHYSKSKFVRQADSEGVDFHLASKPHPLNAVIFPHWIELRKREKVVKNIPIEHVRWIGGLLSQLSMQQIREAFRASGYSPQEADGFTQALQERIQELKRL